MYSHCQGCSDVRNIYLVDVDQMTKQYFIIKSKGGSNCERPFGIKNIILLNLIIPLTEYDAVESPRQIRKED